MNTRDVDIAGERLTLHPERAIYWAAQRTLLLSDVHFGKGAVFRRAGIAVPSGDTDDDLRRLDALIDTFQPHRVVILGDLVHGAATSRSAWVDDVRAWRARHAGIDIVLVAGNHDRHFDVASLGIFVQPDRLAVPPFVLSHHPHAHAGGYVLAGHVHPGVVVRDGWRKHRLPAFVFDRAVGMLPAFGTLTGLHEVNAAPGRQLFASTPAGIMVVR
ncbi:ligase-associated DNA damage response endonuclease PdeM [Luteibacter pinisoli]|uniref:Ligase-associated DNA damage response endonuclease PdeM n=1 Tax=Luteibacter pinisoli TaxID=2589080 RepID=A0A4Y5Z210_9GAMM|nr:ligase-associated DNA damage response endonuclease PdeM [Luteibacter pinisoli]QDE39251.1 ligase-associated DNA damage response endonuclease PdeM [Luteibacter pinisoli]